jgi:hypothetical protein
MGEQRQQQRVMKEQQQQAVIHCCAMYRHASITTRSHCGWPAVAALIHLTTFYTPCWLLPHPPPRVVPEKGGRLVVLGCLDVELFSLLLLAIMAVWFAMWCSFIE